MSVPQVVIAYHDPCLDGYCAYWVAYNTLKEKIKEPVSLIPVGVNYGKGKKGEDNTKFEKLMQHGRDCADHNELWILDFSYSWDQLRQLLEVYTKVILLDHHKTAFESLGASGMLTECDGCIKYDCGGLTIILDKNHSGAMLAWIHIMNGGDIGSVNSAPWQVRYVQDYDLWIKAYTTCDEVNCYLSELEKKTTVWSEANLVEAQEYGALLLRSKKRQINSHMFEANYGEMVGVDGGVVRVGVVMCSVREYISTLGNMLVKEGVPVEGGATRGIDVAVIVSFGGVSLRSLGDMDVATLAQKYGGGGHKNSAGCTKTILEDIKYE